MESSIKKEEEPVIELVNEVPVNNEEKKVIEILKKMNKRRAMISFLESRLGERCCDILVRMVEKGAVQVKYSHELS